MPRGVGRMTLREYLDAVDRMRMAEAEKESLRRQLREGRQEARFVVFAWIRRNEGRRG